MEETVDDGMGFVDEWLEVIVVAADDDDDEEEAVIETIADSPESEKGVQFAIRGAIIGPNTGGLWEDRDTWLGWTVDPWGPRCHSISDRTPLSGLGISPQLTNNL